MNINWKTVIIGFILAIILSKIIGFAGLILGGNAGLLWSFIGQITGYILATIYVGYNVDGDYINGAIHGTIVGIIGGIISLIITGAIFGTFEITTGLIIGLILDAILYGIIGSIGGIIGNIIKVMSSKKGEVVT